jgi:hypothetical protein
MVYSQASLDSLIEGSILARSIPINCCFTACSLSSLNVMKTSSYTAIGALKVHQLKANLVLKILGILK